MIFENKFDSGTYKLVIDGHYLCNRMAFASGVTGFDTPDKDVNEWKKAFASGFASLVDELKGCINSVAIVYDGRSWRKDVKQIVNESLQHLSEDERGYKANRSKDEAPIDIRLALQTFKEFGEHLEKTFGVPFITADGAEGDDLLAYISKYESEKGNKVLLYSSDGDIHQLVNDNVFVYKQMPSDRPNKLVVTQAIKDKYFPQSVDEGEMAVFGQSSIPKDLLVSKYDVDDVIVAEPVDIILLKSISGDAKDNIMPTFQWSKVDSTGQEKTYKPTMMYIKKGLDVMGLTPNDVTFENLYDEVFVRELIENIILNAPLGEKLVDVTRTFKANIKAIISDEKYVKMDGLQKLLLACRGNGEDIRPMYEHFNISGKRFVPTISDVVTSLEEIEVTNDMLTDKFLKGIKFPKPFLSAMMSKIDLLRDVRLCCDIYKQNLMMLHLDESCIPQKTFKHMEVQYDLKKDLPLDIENVSNFQNIISTMDMTHNIFGEMGDMEQVSVGENVDMETDDIMNSVFGGFGM